jgi:hypothetical protein
MSIDNIASTLEVNKWWILKNIGCLETKKKQFKSETI